MRVDPFYVQGLVDALTDATGNEASLSEELSSGLRVTSLSVDPVAVGQSTQIAAEISADDSYVSAAATTQSKLQVTDTALGEVVTQLTRALTLATSGGDGTLNASEKSTIGLELQQVQAQVLALANTSYQGQYVFSGSQGSVQPFTQSGPETDSTTAYNGDNALQYTTTENGQKIQTNVIGSNVFDAPGSSVFQTLSRLVSDFASGAEASVIGADSTGLTAALNTVGQQRSVIDTSLAQVQATSSYAQSDAAQQSAAQTTLVGANTAQVATQLSNVETQSQALSSVIGTLEKGSLFDYIK
jgi:flagellar hook-associated protein 3 FlgL